MNKEEMLELLALIKAELSEIEADLLGDDGPDKPTTLPEFLDSLNLTKRNKT